MVLALVIFTSPYYLLFGRITKQPIDSVLDDGGSDSDVREKVQAWLRIKQKQAQYAQVAVSSYCQTRQIDCQRHS
jgi:hypothetical protein